MFLLWPQANSAEYKTIKRKNNFKLKSVPAKVLTSQTWVHGRAESCHGSWDRELTSLSLASELVSHGP